MSDEFVIQRAERTQVRLRIALQGSSGGGKTASSLLLAKGMVAEMERRGVLPDLPCHIGLLDTERDSAKLYSHLAVFDTIVLEPPYSPKRYLGALRALERAGYSVIIIDQITHEWYGEGGILQMVRDSKEFNDFAKWNGPSQEHELFIDSLLKSPAHLIVTMRSKTAWVLEEEVGKDGKTRKKPKRIGMQAKQREGTEYEFTTLFDLEVGTNIATCLKDRTELFPIGDRVPQDSKPVRNKNGTPSLGIGIGWGEKIVEWVHTAKVLEPAQEGPSAEDRCIAVTDAGIRACQRAENVPDLQVAFLAQRKAIGVFQASAGSDVVAREIARLTAACADRKASFGTAGGVAPVDSGEPVSPDDVINLEMLISDAGILPADVKAKFGIPRLASLDVARLMDVQAWVIEQAGARGISLRPFSHKAAPVDAPSPKEKALEIVDRIAAERSGGDLLAGLKSDVL
jgi:hypothetical protein